jgi:hypothetical protein
MKQRLLVTVVLGCAAAAYTGFVVPMLWPDLRPDFGIIWFGARALFAGRNPYDLVGPGRDFEWGYPLLYPLTSMIAVAPLAPLSLDVAGPIFAGVGAGLLAWVLTRDTIRNPQLLVFASPAMTSALQNVQWAPMLIASASLWPAAWLLSCKPSIGAALFAWRPSRRSLVIAASFTLVTIAIAPWWPAAWLSTLQATAHMKPLVLRPGGFLLLLAALKWRRPEARLLLALACIPQTPVIYETVPLFLIVNGRREGVVLLVLTSITSMNQIVAPEAQFLEWNATLFMWLLYLPCLVMVLRRPNVGEIAPRLERLSAGAARGRG